MAVRATGRLQGSTTLTGTLELLPSWPKSLLPQHWTPLAVEPALLKDRLEKVDALTPLAEALASLSEDLSDTVLDLQALARQPLLDAYAILQTLAKTNPTLKGQRKDVINFYAAAATAGGGIQGRHRRCASTARGAGASRMYTPGRCRDGSRGHR